MNIFTCPKCGLEVEAIALEVWHPCKIRRVQLLPKLQPEVAISDEVT